MVGRQHLRARRSSRSRAIATCALLALIAATLMAVGGGSTAAASSGAKPSVTKDNDANHDTVFSDTENVPKNVSYPWVVTYRLTLDAGTFGSHTIAAISDNMTSTLTSTLYAPSCASLVGSTIAANTTESCYYDVSMAQAASAPVVNTATITWDSGGADTTSNTSTVNFPSLSLDKSSSTTLVTTAGQVVPYTYLVKNTGTVAVSGIVLSDNNTDSTPSCPSSTLAVGASMTCTAQHTVTPTELVAGSVNNIATATSNEAADVMDSLSIPAAVFTLGGTFVVGDLTVGPLGQAVGKNVTFWGAQWWKLNSLSGGTAPASFKGFEDAPAMPGCNVNWTTDPGNSTPPPATIPAYMAIIVSSSITKSGSTISGNTPHLVIVKTDPGYQGNPGHAGTGTTVGVIC
jgi:uncharacterized repeat protein (TIGR01451 family)